MTEVKHTPLPWEKTPGHLSIYAKSPTCTYSTRFIAQCSVGLDGGKAEAEANARLIVRAVNSHADLVEALDWALSELAGATKYPGSPVATPAEQYQNCFDKASEALSKATAE